MKLAFKARGLRFYDSDKINHFVQELNCLVNGKRWLASHYDAQNKQSYFEYGSTPKEAEEACYTKAFNQ